MLSDEFNTVCGPIWNFCAFVTMIPLSLHNLDPFWSIRWANISFSKAYVGVPTTPVSYQDTIAPPLSSEIRSENRWCPSSVIIGNLLFKPFSLSIPDTYATSTSRLYCPAKYSYPTAMLLLLIWTPSNLVAGILSCLPNSVHNLFPDGFIRCPYNP